MVLTRPATVDADDPHEQIARLEERIEALRDAIERCRKLSLAARLVLLAAAVWVLSMLFGIAPLAPFNIIGAIAAALGGTVLLGSNASTWRETAAALQQTEARRNELIGLIQLRVVNERPTLH